MGIMDGPRRALEVRPHVGIDGGICLGFVMGWPFGISYDWRREVREPPRWFVRGAQAMGKILVGIIVGFILAPFIVLAYLEFGQVPVAVADKPFPKEELITHVPLNARIERDKIGTPPIQVNEANLIAGAQIYRDDCAVCHGYNGIPSRFGSHMYPSAPPLWEKHHTGDVVGVSDDPPGETYWKASNGIRLTGMPEYKNILSDTQLWQVSLLLANANKPLPPAALAILHGNAAAAPAAPSTPAKQ